MLWPILNTIQIILIALWTVVCSLTAILLYITTFHSPLLIGVAKYMWSPVLLFISGVRLKVYGKENLDTSRPMIYVSNHESHMDIPALFRAIPVNLHFIAKKELKKVPFMGWAMMAAGMIFIDRKHKEKAMKSIEEAGEKIKRGKNVISFPEGTRTKTGKVGVFKRGTFIMSLSSNVPIVPLAIEGSREVIASGTYKLRPGLIKINIGKPILPEDYKDQEIEQFANVTRNEVLTLLQNISQTE